MYPRYKEDYVKLYIDTVRDEILAHDWTRAFLSSSPTNGHVTEGTVGSLNLPGLDNLSMEMVKAFLMHSVIR